MSLLEKAKKEGVIRYVNSLPFPALVVDSNYEVVLLNESALDRFRANLFSKKCYELTHGIDRPCWEVFGEDACPVKKLQFREEPYAYHEHKNSKLHLLVAGKLDEDLFIELHIDGYIESLIKELKFLAEIDTLTGVYNRRKIEEILEGEIERSKRYGNPLSVILIDIDNFKQLNDTYGHQTGDMVLKEIVSVIRESLRKTDYLGRLGGEEFLVILPETTPERAKLVAERIRKDIENLDLRVGKITVSAGVTGLKKGDTVETLMNRVDRAMYLAKEKGKNRTEVL
ncbi:diguanylate cyclase (GGDEF)-like protein [Hydrogenivirga caldilitoris]|uniref:diguanylate cyclase n=1 Tax=Hydrogenivirga caldilitoris TaxID=246264 RepID=A0A497XR91_9AQUI|nr:GGDEF domain-containing protein [Hydrogenivirga caldilitoris]RLJ70784.1 diguanylate cyclase (GGDEF)-like protein [Hydrogenivirga caldilitoris]